MSLFSLFDIEGWLVDSLSFMASPVLFLVVLVIGVVLIDLVPFLGLYRAAVAVVMMFYALVAGWEHTALAGRQAVADTVVRVNEENRKAKEQIAEQRDRAVKALDEERDKTRQINKALADAHARIAAQAKQPGQNGPMAPVLADEVRSWSNER